MRFRSWALIALVLAVPRAALGADEGEKKGGVLSLLNEQVLLIATVVGAIAALPALIEFLVERRKRKERIALSLDDCAVEEMNPRVAGLDDVLADIADLIDRACNPEKYPSLIVGNEVLIIGGNLSGKKTLAQVIAKAAKMERVITVYNPRNVDALAAAKSLVHRYRRQKVLLLLPRVDSAFEKEDDELLSELEALIETTSERSYVLVVGTAVKLVPDSPLDNAFGIKLVLPGTSQAPHRQRELEPEVKRVLGEVTRFYLRQAAEAGFRLEAMDGAYVEARVLDAVNNPAEIEDILSMCRTLALFERNRGASGALAITPEMLETAISRVIVGMIPGDGTVGAGHGSSGVAGTRESDEGGACPAPT
jgi:hypothetical protein